MREAHGGVALQIDGAQLRPREGEQEEMERRLIAKLDIAGQLRPGYLLRALREGTEAVAVRRRPDHPGPLRTSPRPARRGFRSSPELLALACAAVGIDRSVFPTILDLVRELNGGRPSGGAEGAKRAQGAFGAYGPEVAATAFRTAAMPRPDAVTLAGV